MEMRDLPSVDALAAACNDHPAARMLPSSVVLGIARTTIDHARTALANGEQPSDLLESAIAAVDDVVASMPTAVINATGVLLHTNLGRSLLPQESGGRAADIATHASNVELDIRTGRRSKRHAYLGSLLPVVTGASAGFAVNNNAGALLLSLASVAGNGGRVAVSRGELIEIGGSFRLPSLMEASGATLVEVGTTNRTRPADYAAVAGDVDALLKVHPSNYRIDGFAEETSYEDLAEVAAHHDIPFIADVGSGLMDATAPWLGAADRSWLATEPGVIQTVAAGADLVIFSGDKLLGGPQAGIVVGTSEAVERAAAHPIARAVRLDGQSIASLCSVLGMYADSRVLEIPFWRMATASKDSLRARATSIVKGLGDRLGVVDSEAVPGAGSVPGRTIASVAIRIEGNPDTVWQGLAASLPPVISVRREGAVFVDIRSILPEDDQIVRTAIETVIV